MADDDTLTEESRRTGTRNRSTLTWLVAAAVVLLTAGAALFGVLSGGSGDERSTAPDTETEAAAPTRTTLTVAPGTGRCMTPNVDVLRGQSLALAGVVLSVTESEVMLEPERFYAGEATDVVVVQAPDSDLRALLSAVEFKEGRRYLVAADDGDVLLCGFSGPATDRLARLYDEAYGG